jgi:hypothetical protein
VGQRDLGEIEMQMMQNENAKGTAKRECLIVCQSSKTLQSMQRKQSKQTD